MNDIIITTPMIGFHVEPGTIVITTAELSGGTHEGDDVTCPAGSFGSVSAVKRIDGGVKIDVSVHAGQSPDTGEDLWIVNTFDPDDHEPRYPFIRADSAANALSAIRAAVNAHDDRLNAGVGESGPQPPTGDDYNAIHALIMNGVPTAAADTAEDAPMGPRTLKVLVQQYVEKVAAVKIDVPQGFDHDPDAGIAFAIQQAEKETGPVTWEDGDNAEAVQAYTVMDHNNEIVWER
jgi:hypothetical protein